MRHTRRIYGLVLPMVSQEATWNYLPINSVLKNSIIFSVENVGNGGLSEIGNTHHPFVVQIAGNAER